MCKQCTHTHNLRTVDTQVKRATHPARGVGTHSLEGVAQLSRFIYNLILHCSTIFSLALDLHPPRGRWGQEEERREGDGGWERRGRVKGREGGVR